MTRDADLGADGPAALQRLTFDAVIPGTRKIVARQVASEPLDEYAASGMLSEKQYDAGKRLRTLLASTWPSQRCTARARYASDASEYDDDDGEADEEARWHARNRAADAVRKAQGTVSPCCWPTVRAVCEGYRLGRLGSVPKLKIGLDQLVRLWR